MPEYLAPGVFVEEVSYRAKSIEGVATSTTAIAGVTAYGPVDYLFGPRDGGPRLITSFTEFERVYGRLRPLEGDRPAVTAHAARAFFLNGGQRLYVSRVMPQPVSPPVAPPIEHGPPSPGVASAFIPVGSNDANTRARFKARWPGAAGNVRVTVVPVRGKNVGALPRPDEAGNRRANGARHGALVEVYAQGTPPPGTNAPVNAPQLRLVEVDAAGRQALTGGVVNAGDDVYIVELEVRVQVDAERVDRTPGLACHPQHRRYIGTVLGRDDPEDDTSTVWLDPVLPDQVDPKVLIADLTGTDPLFAAQVFDLTGGSDGGPLGPADIQGREADEDRPDLPATGLAALADIEDVAIVIAPDAATLGTGDEIRVATDYLIAHASAPGRYRIAIVDPPQGQSLNEVRVFRGQFDTTHAAMYYPWIEILDPSRGVDPGAPPTRIQLPPSGFVAGIYARSDVARGVFKAPANEVVFGLTRFEVAINTPRQQVLNPEGVNCLRFFPGRGSRVWGARTMTSDPEWRYVNVRRFFLFLEHSIDRATQWAVFEPNGDALWRKISRTIEDFLDVQWRDGALLGSTRQQAYFVRCDRTTMTQNDLDNGRLICQVGVAALRPAEFVIFRIGQWTADARN